MHFTRKNLNWKKIQEIYILKKERSSLKKNLFLIPIWINSLSRPELDKARIKAEPLVRERLEPVRPQVVNVVKVESRGEASFFELSVIILAQSIRCRCVFFHLHSTEILTGELRTRRRSCESCSTHHRCYKVQCSTKDFSGRRWQHECHLQCRNLHRNEYGKGADWSPLRG